MTLFDDLNLKNLLIFAILLLIGILIDFILSLVEHEKHFITSLPGNVAQNL